MLIRIFHANTQVMKPKFKRADVVYLNDDSDREIRTKYKIIEFYLGEIPDDVAESKIHKGRIVDGTTNSEYNYMIEPLTDGAGRIVEESEIEGLSE